MAHDPPTTRVDVWVTLTETVETRARLDAYHSLLSPDEASRAARFFRSEDTVRFVIGRALARTMLSRFADVAPADWLLEIDAHGRPQLAWRPSGAPDLRFNLTHTDGLVACAVTVGREVGIDVERIDRRVTRDLPERFFSARETADLRALPDADQEVVFFDYWTLKEAYIKARGLGLALPLRHFAFVRRPGRAPEISFDPELHDDPASWQFAQFWPSPDHRMAVAVRRHGPDVPIHVEHRVP